MNCTDCGIKFGLSNAGENDSLTNERAKSFTLRQIICNCCLLDKEGMCLKGEKNSMIDDYKQKYLLC